ncbi:uncharacterized protein LOC135489542 [Lineus longissimus]|uniref:uncharacterized protein LOC135489542 n=1 Tax=Lineus longissimus TaxID=88925 RepID=UPI00315CF93D
MQEFSERPKRQRRDGGTRCAAWGCDKSKLKDCVGVFEFPAREKSPERFDFWCKAVRRTRQDFKFVKGTSRLCGDHFDRDQIDNWMQIRIMLEDKGLEAAQKISWRLVPKAKPNPDLFPKRPTHGTPSPNVRPSVSSSSFAGGSTPRRPPTSRPWATKKDRRKRVKEAMEVLLPSSGITESADSTTAPSSPVPGPSSCEADSEAMEIECNDTNMTKLPELVDQYVQTKRTSYRSFHVQVMPNTFSQGTQTDTCKCMCNCPQGCDLPDPPLEPDVCSGTAMPVETDDDSVMETEDEMHDSVDPDYEPNSADESDDCDEREFEDWQNEVNKDPVSEEKYFVFHSCLMTLFASCPVCSSESSGHIKRIGTFISIEQHCSNSQCGFSRVWHSQPMCGKVPAGNILLSGSILFSGSIPGKILRFLKLFGCQAFSRTTYFNHQRMYLSPAMTEVWSKEQHALLVDVKESDAPLVVGGDGRSDTPGHSAKYGSYSLMDLDNKKIIAMELVQSTEVKSSVHMEKEGLIRCVRILDENDVSINKIITDRHCQIQKWLRENLGGTSHFFDAWHLAKNVKKKVLKIAKLKGCEIAAEWCKAITNHLYYVASNTPEGQSDLIIAKWKSLDNHLHNIHKGHGNLFPKCGHGTRVSNELTKIITAPRLVKDIGKISCSQQTSGIEAFHSVVNHFAPKQIHFFPDGMESRLCIAALHYNENGKKEQAVNKDGKERWDVFFPKVKKGGHSVRPVRKESTYGYAKRLMDEAHHRLPLFLSGGYLKPTISPSGGKVLRIK